MKKFVKIFILFLIVLLVYEIYNFKTDKLYYISIGDSLALGLNPYNEVSFGYTDYLKDYLKKHNKLAYYKSYSKIGYTIDDLINDIKDNNVLKKDLRESDLVTISIGANDLLKKASFKELEITKILSLKTEIDDIMPNLDSGLKEIRKYAKERIIIVGYYNPIPFLFNTSSNDLDELFAYVDEEYLKLAKKYDCEYVSIYQLFKTNKAFLPNPNSMYPSIKGYEAIATSLIKKIFK